LLVFYIRFSIPYVFAVGVYNCPPSFSGLGVWITEREGASFLLSCILLSGLWGPFLIDVFYRYCGGQGALSSGREADFGLVSGLGLLSFFYKVSSVCITYVVAQASCGVPRQFKDGAS
jgi:hypothetical protein